MIHGVALRSTATYIRDNNRKKIIGERNKYNFLLFSTFTADSAGQMISPDAGKRGHRNFFPSKRS
jgi:hypothetical protein